MQRKLNVILKVLKKKKKTKTERRVVILTWRN